jgi:hypothetical protein
MLSWMRGGSGGIAKTVAEMVFLSHHVMAGTARNVSGIQTCPARNAEGPDEMTPLAWEKEASVDFPVLCF